MSDDMPKNGKGMAGNLKRQFRSPRDDWDVPVTTNTSIDIAFRR